MKYNSIVSKPLATRLSLLLSCLLFALIATNARATIYYWDNNGLSAPTSGTWDTTTPQWATTSTPTDTPVAWPTPGVAAGFPVGTAPLSSLNIAVNSAIDIAGIFNGLASTVGVTNLVISGAGSLNIVDGIQGFWTGNAGFNTVLQVPLTGTGGLQNQSSGSLWLSGQNTFSGGIWTATSAGLNFNSGNALGTGIITNTTATTVFATPAKDSAGNNFATAPITITNSYYTYGGAAGTLIYVGIAAAPTTFSGPIVLANPVGTAETFQNQPGGTLVAISGPISGAANFTKTGAGKLALTGNNTYTGKTTVNNGILSVVSYNSVVNGAASSSLGVPPDATTGTINIGATTANITHIYAGPGETTDRVINLSGTTGGITLQADGTGPVVFTSAFTATGAGAKNLNLQGSNTGDNTIAAIVNSSAATSVNKADTGTWVLAGASSYTGATTISNGTLKVNGNISSSSSVTVKSPGILQGTGTTPSVTLNSGGTISPGNGVGTISTGNETWNGGAHYAWQINDATAAAGTGFDTIAVNGTLSIAATSGSKFNIDIQSLSGSTPGNAANFGTSGTWTLATASGGITGYAPAAFAINTNNLSNATGGNVFVVSLSADSKSLQLNLVTPVQNQTATGAGSGTFTGSPNTSYTVQYTDSLSPINWQTLAVVKTDGSGVGSYSDPGPLPSMRFYRISTP
jgi:autotransporter-associated beta strand protein